MIHLKGISKSFSGQTVLDSITLNFREGQTHVLLGSSGSGKSTLLRIVMGLIRPDQGEVEINGQKITGKNQREIAKTIGYVIQDGGLFPHLNVSENVTLVAKLNGWKKSQIESRLSELLATMELEPSLLLKYPRQISGGQRQRVGLMRALMINPKVLLLDEPLGALDPIVRSALQIELKRIFNGLKKTVLIVTHDIGEAAFFGHTVTLMNRGRVLQHSSFEELVEKPADSFVTEFINAQRPPPQLKILL